MDKSPHKLWHFWWIKKNESDSWDTVDNYDILWPSWENIFPHFSNWWWWWTIIIIIINHHHHHHHHDGPSFSQRSITAFSMATALASPARPSARRPRCPYDLAPRGSAAHDRLHWRSSRRLGTLEIPCWRTEGGRFLEMVNGEWLFWY